VQITADVLLKDFQQAWTAALHTVAVAMFCNNLPQTITVHAYQAALTATLTPPTICTATTVHTQQTIHADHAGDEAKCTGAGDPPEQVLLPPDSDNCIEYIPQPPLTAQPSARMDSNNNRPSSASLRPGRILKTSDYQPM
jgi:hypothetical protein